MSRTSTARQRVGEYTLLAKIGEGGMGIVHLARRGTGEQVALKLLRPQVVGDDEGRRRLAREVGSLSRVRSQWIAEVIDADPQAPVPYIATRYVAGPSLHDLITDSGPLDGTDLYWFARCLARGLAAVHDAGVLHRDVKPANVLLDGDDPVLIDFGLARLADDPKVTATGYLLGTPGYLAPEILHGQDATAASDVHSWAATVAFAGLGRPPFGRGPSMAIMDRVRRGEHDLSGLDPELAELLSEALDPDPAARPLLPGVLARLRELDPLEGLDAEAEPTEVIDPTRRMPLAAPPAPIPPVPAPSRIAPAPVAAAYDGDDELVEEFSDPQAWEELARPKPRFAHRLRRGMLVVALGAVVAGGMAVYPLPTLVVVGTAVALLRFGSMAGSVLSDRRRLLGRKWYDTPWAVIRSPWDFLRSLPFTALLCLWSGGMAAAAALLCFAFAAGEAPTLGIAGATFAVGLWIGPGSTRVRSPVRRMLTRPARPWPLWLALLVVLLGGAAALAWLALTTGTDWFPFWERPWVGLRGMDLSDLAPW